MNQITVAVVSILIFLSAQVMQPASAGEDPGADQAAAESVLTRYFAALSQGDTLTLRSLMGGSLLEKRSLLLDNPTYPAHLTSTYGQALFRINSYATFDDNSVSISATIDLSPDESINKRFLLKRELRSDMVSPQFLIIDETTEK